MQRERRHHPRQCSYLCRSPNLLLHERWQWNWHWWRWRTRAFGNEACQCCQQFSICHASNLANSHGKEEKESRNLHPAGANHICSRGRPALCHRESFSFFLLTSVLLLYNCTYGGT